MKRDFLKELGVGEDLIDAIMAEHGKSVERFKSEAQSAAQWQARAQEAQLQAQQEIEAVKRDALIREGLAHCTFTSEYAKQGVIGALQKQNLQMENGSLVGLEQAVDELRAASPDAFGDPASQHPLFTTAQRQEPAAQDSAIRAVMGLPE